MKGVRNVAIDMTGRRFGSLVVLSFAGRRWCAGGQTKRRWLCRCDCGLACYVDGCHLRSGVTRQCRACGNAASGQKTSIRLATGETLYELAGRTGLAFTTVYQRFHRGWPHERLGEPLHK